MSTIRSIYKLINICKILSGADIFLVIALIFLSTIAEAFSVGIIIPIFTNQSTITEAISKYGFHAGAEYLVGLVVFIFILKSWFVWFVMDKQNSYSFKMQYLASIKIFSSVGSENYQHVIGKGKDYFSSLFNVDLIHFRDTLLLVIMLLTESAVVIGLFIVAIYFAPLYTLAVLFILIGAALTFRITFAHTSSQYGRRRIYADRAKNTWIRGFLGSLEESKILGISDFFLKNFDAVAKESSDVGARQITVNQSPRFLFESLVVAMIGVIVISMIVENNSTHENGLKNSLLSLITLAAIAFRVLPSLNRISGALQGISFGAPAIDAISDELIWKNGAIVEEGEVNCDTSKIMSIEIRDVYLSIDNNLILRGCSAYFCIGGINALIGESGAGKSSLVRSILGLYKIDHGSILINNCESNLSNYIKTGRIALVPQQSFLIDGTILENVLVGREYSHISIDKVSQLLDWANSLPNGINTLIGETGLQISGGQAQRLNIARALYGEPEFVIMDESTSALDMETQESTVRYLDSYSLNHLVIMITHREELLKKCKSIFKIHDGLLKKCV